MRSAQTAGKKNIEAQVALSDVSSLLSRMARSRKAQSKLQDIINLTREVARLGRALNGHGVDGTDDDGYGDRSHFLKISGGVRSSGVIR